MAAYAALVSLMHIIDNLQLHPRPPISLHKNQVYLLTQKITILQEFLEGYNPNLDYSAEADPLESRIADAAYAAEDVIESHIVDHITNDGENISSDDSLYEALEKVIEEMALIEKEAMQIKQTVGFQHTNSMPPDSLRSSSSISQNKSRMVGADELLLEMKDKLTSHRLDLQIIPIVGMGGAGKTTLARNIYQDRLIKERFDKCAWATISQGYSIQEILKQILHQLNQNIGQNLSEDVLGEILYKHLYGRKYLIIMDDMWNIDAWDEVKWFLPDNRNGSRIVVTTRLSNLASELPNSSNLEMKLLDEVSSWELLSKSVFGEESCPLELEEIGKEIGKSCKGLPLSIVVVGGFLAKSEHTKRIWKYIEENLNEIVNLEDDGRCLRILYMSYKQLPVFLKACFLYMGVYPEDGVIRISKLIKLWVAEGFIKEVSGKSLEEMAKEYLKDLISRNLILIHELGSTGNIKYCKIHDLSRDVCLREAAKERFYTVVSKPPTTQGIVNGIRRIVISSNEAILALSSSMPLARSFIWHHKAEPPISLNFRLLRILQSNVCILEEGSELSESIHQLVNSRFLAFSAVQVENFPRSMWQFWNLQTLIVELLFEVDVPIDIWYMSHIRHVQFSEGLHLPDPPKGEDDVVLGNLQTLGTVKNFKFSEQAVKRIPNIKKLNLLYDSSKLGGDAYCIGNLDCLDKLESLSCKFTRWINGNGSDSLQRLINFPLSLKKLTLYMNESQYWEHTLDKIGSLPLLQKLKLEGGSFKEGQWETTEGQFHSLKFLALSQCKGLQVWTTESSHFPCLERLRLLWIDELEEIPLDFAEISTLQGIEVYLCSDSAVISARRIVEEQEELYGEVALQVRVRLLGKNNNKASLVESLASPNFRFENL